MSGVGDSGGGEPSGAGAAEARHVSKRLLDLDAFDCRAPLPGQDHRPAPERLFCAAPFEPGRTFSFCRRCRARFVERPPSGAAGKPFVLLGQREAGAPKPRRAGSEAAR